jgi:MFS family permease
VASELKQNTSVRLALKSRVFFGLWLASVVSGVCVAAHDTVATWLMNTSGSSTLLLPLMATAASLPFFLFTFPAGALADLSNGKKSTIVETVHNMLYVSNHNIIHSISYNIDS